MQLVKGQFPFSKINDTKIDILKKHVLVFSTWWMAKYIFTRSMVRKRSTIKTVYGL